MATEKVLIVDDSETKLAIYSQVLKKEGYVIIGACDGEDGIRKASSENPDVIVTDLAMPKMDGFAFYKELNLGLGFLLALVFCIIYNYFQIIS